MVRGRGLAVGFAITFTIAMTITITVGACVSESTGSQGRGPSSTVAGLPVGADATVARVVDGDTVVVELDGHATTVRLIGVDTPETKDPRTPVQCYGREASARTERLLPGGTPVRIVYDVERNDRYGRTLAYVYRAGNGSFVNAALVRDGYALAYTHPPNVAHASDFVALQRTARETRRGLWGACPAEEQEDEPEPGPEPGGNGCDPAYPDACIPPSPPDLDCVDVTARGFRVMAPDPHRFDSNGDGVGCEQPGP